MKNLLKNILFSLLVIAVFFGFIELAQRVRYSLRYKSAAWMYYGMDSYTEKHPDKFLARYGTQDKGREDNIKKNANPELIVSSVDGIRVFKFNYDMKPSYKKLIAGTYLLNENALMRVNSRGFRGAEITFPKKETRIFMLGASSTLGTDSNDDKTYPYLVDEILSDEYKKNVEVINAGIGGSNAKEMYHLLKEEILKLEPDIVTLYSGYNNWNTRSYKNGIGWRSAVFKLKEFLLGKSLVFCTLNEKSYLLKKKQIDSLYYNPGMAEAILKDKKIWSDYRENLKKICLLTKDNGKTLILMTQPLYLVSKNPRTLWENRNLWEKHCRLTNDIIKETARDYGVECIDVAEHFDRMSDEKKKEMFVDVVHLTDKGNRIVAEIMAKEINAILNR